MSDHLNYNDSDRISCRLRAHPLKVGNEDGHLLRLPLSVHPDDHGHRCDDDDVVGDDDDASCMQRLVLSGGREAGIPTAAIVRFKKKSGLAGGWAGAGQRRENKTLYIVFVGADKLAIYSIIIFWSWV